MNSQHRPAAVGFHSGELAAQRQAGVQAEAARLARMVGPAELRGGTAAFLADFSRDAYEKQVDRLLASRRHGERMAVWWLQRRGCVYALPAGVQGVPGGTPEGDTGGSLAGTGSHTSLHGSDIITE